MKCLNLNEGTSGRLLCASAVLSVLVVSTFLFFKSRAEPEYKGKTLLEWTAWLDRKATPAQEQEAIEAIRVLYPRPVTVLARWIDYDPAPRRWRVTRALRWAPAALENSIALTALRDAREDRIYAAAAILRALGPEAADAVPELEQLANSTNRFVAGNAIAVLGLMGPHGLAGLSNIVERPAHPLRAFAISRFYEMRHLGTNTAGVISLMARVASESDPAIAAAGIHALAQLHAEPSHSLPKLTEALQHPDRNVRTWGLRGLAAFGPAASESVPQLLPFLQDPEDSIRWDASNALWNISPQSITNSPLALKAGTN